MGEAAGLQFGFYDFQRAREHRSGAAGGAACDKSRQRSAIGQRCHNDYNCAGMRLWVVGLIIVVFEQPI